MSTPALFNSYDPRHWLHKTLESYSHNTQSTTRGACRQTVIQGSLLTTASLIGIAACATETLCLVGDLFCKTGQKTIGVVQHVINPEFLENLYKTIPHRDPLGDRVEKIVSQALGVLVSTLGTLLLLVLRNQWVMDQHKSLGNYPSIQSYRARVLARGLGSQAAASTTSAAAFSESPAAQPKPVTGNPTEPSSSTTSTSKAMPAPRKRLDARNPEHRRLNQSSPAGMAGTNLKSMPPDSSELDSEDKDSSEHPVSEDSNVSPSPATRTPPPPPPVPTQAALNAAAKSKEEKETQETREGTYATQPPRVPKSKRAPEGASSKAFQAREGLNSTALKGGKALLRPAGNPVVATQKKAQPSNEARPGERSIGTALWQKLQKIRVSVENSDQSGPAPFVIDKDNPGVYDVAGNISLKDLKVYTKDLQIEFPPVEGVDESQDTLEDYLVILADKNLNEGETLEFHAGVEGKYFWVEIGETFDHSIDRVTINAPLTLIDDSKAKKAKK